MPHLATPHTKASREASSPYQRPSGMMMAQNAATIVLTHDFCLPFGAMLFPAMVIMSLALSAKSGSILPFAAFVLLQCTAFLFLMVVSRVMEQMDDGYTRVDDAILFLGAIVSSVSLVVAVIGSYVFHRAQRIADEMAESTIRRLRDEERSD